MSVSYDITRPTRANSFILLGIFWIIIELAILIVKMEPIFAWYDFLLIGAGYLFFGFAALNILNNFLYEKYKTSIGSLVVNFALFLVILVFISSIITYVFLFLDESRNNVKM